MSKYLPKDVLDIKVILIGDSAVGKSKLTERFLLDGYSSKTRSTYGVDIYYYSTKVGEKKVKVEFWDTAGQERFNTIRKSFFEGAHGCLIVFDVTRQASYSNLEGWYKTMRKFRPEIPTICLANKIDTDPSVTKKKFYFAKKRDIPFDFVSAASGINVVKNFKKIIELSMKYKLNPPKDDYMEDLNKILLDD